MSARKITRIAGFPEFFHAVMRDDPKIGRLRLAGCSLAQQRDVVRVLTAFRDRELARGYEVLEAAQMIKASAPRLRTEQVFATLYAARGGWQLRRPSGLRRR